MEYGHSWTNLRDREKIFFFFFEKKSQRKKFGENKEGKSIIEESQPKKEKKKKKKKKEYNRREKDSQVYGVYSACHMRSLILNEEEVIRPKLGPIEPNFMQMRLQSPCFMDLRHKHVAWTKLAKSPY